jgi:excisionase family DNA binding protein
MTNEKVDEWLTGKEAASLLNLTVRSIENHRAAGRLPFMKTETGSVRYRRQHVEALLKPGAPSPVAPGKSWTATRWTSEDARELPNSLTRAPSRRAEAA